MKTLKHLFFVFAFAALLFACKNENKESSQTSTVSETESSTKKTGQAFIQDDEGTPNCLQIAIGSPDHKTLVAAVQAAQV